MTKYGHWKSTYDAVACHIRNRTTHCPTIYGKWPLIRRYLKIRRVLFSAVYRWPSFTCQDIRCGAGKQEPPENKMADKQKLTKGKRAVPYSKKKAPAKKTANEEPWPLRLHRERLESGSTSWAGKRQTRDCSTPAFRECFTLWSTRRRRRSNRGRWNRTGRRRYRYVSLFLFGWVIG